jgi:acetyl esterase/lipase
MLIIGFLAAIGAALTYLLVLPAVLRTSVPFGILFAVLGVTQLGSVIAVIAHPSTKRIRIATAAAGAVLVFWALQRLFGMFHPDPWVPVNSVIGFTDYLVALLELIAVAILGGRFILGRRPGRTPIRRVLLGLAMVPLLALTLLTTTISVLATGDGLAGAGFPAGTVEPRNLPAGARSTVEYCSPNGNPLAMDIYTPPAGASRPAPVALYIHGGGLVFGDRKTRGVGNALADHEGALFLPLQKELNARGFLVASIDYRLPPATAWPGQLDDARCAVRFLHEHAADLGIDPNRIVTWGSSAGGLLVSILGLTDSTGSVRAVVDMFSPADLNNLGDADPIMKAAVWTTWGSDAAKRRSGSPVSYVHPTALPFMVLHGTDDPEIPIHQSEIFAERLQAANVPTTFIKVQGAGHSLATPGQSPTPDQLVTKITEFFTSAV